MRMTLRWTAFLASVCALLAFAPAAGAAQRFVSPGGSGSACTSAVPCSLPTGFNNAGSGDEVIIAAGTYTTATPLSNAHADLNVHGAGATAKPVITSSAAATAIVINGGGANVADLVINAAPSQSGLFITGEGIQVERTEVHSNGSSACNISGSGLVRDSLCVNTGTGGIGFTTSIGGDATMKLRNVTAIASGGGTSTGLGASESGMTLTMDARNVIAFGVGRDVEVRASTPASVTSIDFENSNFATITHSGSGTTNATTPGSGTNQTAKPLFTDTTSYRQAPGSPTIDAGALDADTGATDIDGQARVQGPQIDIGADEAPDLTPPETTIGGGPKARTKSRNATFTFSSSEAGATFTCALDDKAAAPCSSPLVLAHIKRGPHHLTVVSTDAAGNADASPATYSWKVKKKRKRKHHHGHHH